MSPGMSGDSQNCLLSLLVESTVRGGNQGSLSENGGWGVVRASQFNNNTSIT